ECIDLAVRYRLTPGISDTEQLEAYNELANKQNARLPIWLLTNVGFNRSGYREQDAFSGFVKRASACPKLYIDAVYAHMTNAHAEADISLRQIEAFFERVSIAERILNRKVATSLFASHSILRWSKTYPTDWVRPGIII